MKRSMQWLAGLAVCCCLAYAGQASAGSATFIDNGTGSMTVNYVFPSQTSVTTCAGQDTCPLPTSQPDITTVVVEWTTNAAGQNVLTSIALTSVVGGPMPWDSLFINSDYTGSISDLESWNYYVLTDFDGGHVVGTLPGDGVYEVAANYTYTTATTGRIGHANGIDSADLNRLSSANIARLGSDEYGNQVLTYNFSSLTTQIILGDNFAIGWTPYCANDVVLVAGSTSSVPEPATMALFGMGMTGLTGWQVRRVKNKK